MRRPRRASAVVYQAGWEAERADDYKMCRLRVRAELLNRIKLICLVHSPLQKYSGFRLTQIKSISFAVLPHTATVLEVDRRSAGLKAGAARPRLRRLRP